MMTLEQLGQLAMLWYEADEDFDRRIAASPRLPHKRALDLLDRRHNALRAACRDYKLLQEAKGK